MMSLLLPSIQEAFELMAEPLQAVKDSLQAIRPPQSQALADTVRQSLNSGGKYLRPALTLLVGGATRAENPGKTFDQALVEAAAVTEMIHVATLLHDDVIDRSDLRRGQKTARAVWGDKIAVLGGDYLLAQASVKLAALGNTRLVSIFAWVLSDLCNGEVEQMQASYPPHAAWDSETQWESYFHKTFCKTASLFSAGCESAGVLNALAEPEIQGLKDYGRHLGIAFQVMDDLLDYTATEEELGKPVLGDLRNGLMNAPILLALESDRLKEASRASLREAVETLFKQPDAAAAEQVQALLRECNALEETRRLAKRQVQMGLDAIRFIPNSPERSALETIAQYVTERSL